MKQSIKFIVTIITSLIIIGTSYACTRCGFTKNSKRFFPAHSREFARVLQFTERRLRVDLSSKEESYLNKILFKENRRGDITLRNPRSTAFGLFQGLRRTYINVGVPYGIKCASCQTEMGVKYIIRRYHVPSRAYQHHRRRGWY